MSRTIVIILCSYFFLLCSCTDEDVNPGKDLNITGLKPVYITFDSTIIRSEAPRDFDMLGNVVTLDDFILIIEELVGIHVIDNSNPSNPVTIQFWNIPGISEFTISDKTLYATFGADLVLIDITDLYDIDFVGYIEDFFSESEDMPWPDNYFGPFECVDGSLGIPIGWVNAELNNPKCWR